MVKESSGKGARAGARATLRELATVAWAAHRAPVRHSPPQLQALGAETKRSRESGGASGGQSQVLTGPLVAISAIAHLTAAKI